MTKIVSARLYFRAELNNLIIRFLPGKKLQNFLIRGKWQWKKVILHFANIYFRENIIVSTLLLWPNSATYNTFPSWEKKTFELFNLEETEHFF